MSKQFLESPHSDIAEKKYRQPMEIINVLELDVQRLSLITRRLASFRLYELEHADRILALLEAVERSNFQRSMSEITVWGIRNVASVKVKAKDPSAFPRISATFQALVRSRELMEVRARDCVA